MDIIERASRAKEFLESRTFKEVMAEIKADLVSKMEQVPFADIDAQHELILMLQLQKQIVSRLTRWVDDGKIENKSAQQRDWVEKARALTGFRR